MNIYKVFGLLAPIITFISIAVAILIHPWFSFTENAISDLGALGVENNYVLNIGLIISGFFGVLFSYGLFKLQRTSLGRISSIIVIFGCFFLILIGLFPEGTNVHFTVSVSFFVVTAIGILLTGLNYYNIDRPYSVVTLFLVLVGLIVSLYSLNTFSGVAIAELTASVVFSIWMIMTSERIFD